MSKALGFAFLVGAGGLVHALGHLLAGLLAGGRVEEFRLGAGPRLLTLGRLSLRLLPLWSTVVWQGQREEGPYRELPPGRRLALTLGGPAANLGACFLLLLALALTSGRILAAERADVVHRVWPGGGAQAAGLQTGDRILAIDGQPFRTLEQLQARLASGPAVLEVERDGQVLRLAVRPAGGRARLGAVLRPQIDFEPLEPGPATLYALRTTAALFLAPVRAYDFRSGLLSLPSGGVLLGPSAWNEFPRAGLLVGLASVNAWLALMLVLPLPGADGMRLVIQLLSLAGWPVPAAAEERLQRFGTWAFGTAYAFMLAIIAMTG
ncbi:MAG TPA: M50 family metallopeptidase [Candidatus Nitrosotenuis sp.]|nr:M50 family metallopeptidase [Candidatus Nitrosotenuis sp.]